MLSPLVAKVLAVARRVCAYACVSVHAGGSWSLDGSAIVAVGPCRKLRPNSFRSQEQ